MVKTFQNSNTSNLVFKIPFLVHYLSQFMTLLLGEVIRVQEDLQV